MGPEEPDRRIRPRRADVAGRAVRLKEQRRDPDRAHGRARNAPRRRAGLVATGPRRSRPGRTADRRRWSTPARSTTAATPPSEGPGPDGGKPRPIRVLRRGDVKSPAQEVGPGSRIVLRGLSGDFHLPAGHAEGDRRAALAVWLTDPRNPLTWRSIVNRVWQYHFGRGLVASPNDFGRMGQLPSHPELLDWLAVEFRDGGQSPQDAPPADRDERDLSPGLDGRRRDGGARRRQRVPLADEPPQAGGRGDPRRDPCRRREARPIDVRPGLPGLRVEHPEHSPHYEYDLHDPDDPKCRDGGRSTGSSSAPSPSRSWRRWTAPTRRCRWTGGTRRSRRSRLWPSTTTRSC